MNTYAHTSAQDADMPSKPGKILDQNLQRDDLHILPLHHIPLQTPGLQKAKMVKNAQLESVIELFNEGSTGSGQVHLRDLFNLFPSYEKQLEADIPTLQQLSKLASFDVYSLRIGIREMGIKVNDIKQLRLSEDKKMELAYKMAQFTRPLIYRIYGDSQHRISDLDDVWNLFRSPNRDEALTNLRTMAQQLKIQLHELPDFLEEYGDVFLSLSYFEHELDKIRPVVSDFTQQLEMINQSSELRQDNSVQKMVRYVDVTMNKIMTALTDRLHSFRRKFEDIWMYIDVFSFTELKNMIERNHNSLGGVLCGLAVKMRQWELRGSHRAMSPRKMSEFVRADVYVGLDKLLDMEVAAKKLAL